jgi:hypothetical protein
MIACQMEGAFGWDCLLGLEAAARASVKVNLR